MPLSPLTPAVFCTPLDNPPIATTVSVAHTAGGPTITVTSAAGLGTPSPTAPVRLTAFRGSDPSALATYTKTHYKVTAVAGSVLTIAPIDGYADIALQTGDLVYCNVSAGSFADIHAAVLGNTAATNAIVPIANAIPTGGTTGQVLAKTSGTDYATAWTTPSGGSGSGTVTTVSVATGNGVSGTVANPTTTPAITLTLGAITPASVASIGTVSGSNLSGTNTGDQTNITGNAATVTTNANLTGPVTSVGNATTIVAGAVTNAMLAGSITASKLVRTDLVLTESQVTGLTTDLAAKAPLASPTFTGTVTLPVGLTGLAKLTSGVVSAAVAGTDYQAAGSYSPLAGSTSIVTVGTIATGTWQGTAIGAPYLPAMVASGASHAAGLVPDPGLTAGTTKFLREDATFAVPSATVASGTSGRVPFETTGGVLTDSANLIFSGTALTVGKAPWPTNYPILSKNSSVALSVENEFGTGVFTVFNSALTLNNYTTNANTLFSAVVMTKAGSVFPQITMITGVSNAVGDLLGSIAWPVVDSGGNGRDACRIVALAGSVANADVRGLLDFYAGNNTHVVRLQGGGTSAPILSLMQPSSTSTDRNAGIIDATLATATDASWKGRLVLYAGDYTSSNAGQREGVRVESDGTQPLVSVYGATAVARASAIAHATNSTDVITQLNLLIDAIKAFGITN